MRIAENLSTAFACCAIRTARRAGAETKLRGFARMCCSVAAALLLAALAGCASYRPLPLDDHPTAPASVQDIRIDRARLAFPSLRAHRFDPSDGLDATEVAMLAVANNPELKLARDAARVARAQSFAARLLPDPQLGLTRDLPRPSAADAVSAFSAGLDYDLSALVARAAAASAADARLRQVDLNLLWQEWRLIGAARILFARAVGEAGRLRWLGRKRALLAERYRQARAAETAGDLAADRTNAALAAWQDAVREERELARRRDASRRDLNALLGLAPDTKLVLVEGAAAAVPRESEVRAALAQLPARRPDLLALKAGYAAADARYRQAILAQFPALNLGLARARDTAGLLTSGIALSMALPLLGRNRADVRIEQATRRRLHDEYEQRILQARAEVEGVLADDRITAAELRSAEAALPRLDRAAADAHLAYAAGDLDGPSDAAFESASIAKHVEVDRLRQTLLRGRIVLMSLLGGEFPAHGATTEKHG